MSSDVGEGGRITNAVCMVTTNVNAIPIWSGHREALGLGVATISPNSDAVIRLTGSDTTFTHFRL